MAKSIRSVISLLLLVCHDSKRRDARLEMKTTNLLMPWGWEFGKLYPWSMIWTCAYQFFFDDELKSFLLAQEAFTVNENFQELK